MAGWPHGGGAFSGRDPTKVDRSALRRPLGRPERRRRGLADRFEVEVAYGIGIARPVSLSGRLVRDRRPRGRRDPQARRAPTTCGPPRSSRPRAAGRSAGRPRPMATSAARTSTCRGKRTDKAAPPSPPTPACPPGLNPSAPGRTRARNHGRCVARVHETIRPEARRSMSLRRAQEKTR